MRLDRELFDDFYRFLARLTDDPLIDSRLRGHAQLLRNEILKRHPGMNQILPKAPNATPGFIESSELRRRA